MPQCLLDQPLVDVRRTVDHLGEPHTVDLLVVNDSLAEGRLRVVIDMHIGSAAESIEH